MERLTPALDAFLEHRRRLGLTPATIEQERHDLRRLELYATRRRLTRPQAITLPLLEAFVVWLRRRYRPRGLAARGRRLAPATVTHNVLTVRLFLRFLAREGVLLVDPTSGWTFRRPRESYLDRSVSAAELAGMVATLDVTTAMGVRDRALLETLFGCGLRRSELVALDTTDLNLAGGELLVRRGKGGSSRRVPLAGQARRWLTRYLCRARLELVGGQHHPALFVGMWGHRLGVVRVWQIVSERARAAGITRRISPHRLRHGFATSLVKGGADVRLVQAMLGHRCLTTTERYTAVDVADLAATHLATHPRAS